MENNETYRIVADSAADLYTLDCVPFSAAPLKIITAEREFCDTKGLNVSEMVDYLKSYKGKSSSSCPNPSEWVEAFGDAKYVFAVTITSGLSGSCGAAEAAKQIYEAEHPERKVFIVDSLSAGPGERILAEKLEELVMSGMVYEDICKEIKAYQQKTGLLFVLQSLTNLANNGRVSNVVAKLAGFLGICLIGKASDEGTLEPLKKCRGFKNSIENLVGLLKENGFCGGKVFIAHCLNEVGALELKERIAKEFRNAEIKVYETKGLCSFYAEKGGLLVGYEKI